MKFWLSRLDAVAWLAALPAESVDLIVTDPAYESLEKHRAVGTTTRLTGDWFDIFPNSRFPEFFRHLYRVMKRNTHGYLFCDQETAFIVKPMIEAAGFRFWKPLIWNKMKMGMGYHYRAQYEMILFFEKGKRKLNNLGISDVISVDRVRGQYPTEKPVPVNETLVTQSSQPGEIVIDPFMGSGSAGVAACMNQRLFMGSDIAQRAVDITRGRLEALGAVESTPSFAEVQVVL